MKKITIIFVIIIAILGMFWYSYEKAKITNNSRVVYNSEFERLQNKEISGLDLASVINKVADNNDKNYVEKNDEGLIIENDTNSIYIEIKFIDNDSKIRFEKIYNNDIKKFINLYSTLKFELKDIQYHKKTQLVKYMYFEEV